MPVYENHNTNLTLTFAPLVLYAYPVRGNTLKTHSLFSHAVAQEVVVLLNTGKSKVRTKVGVGWQPDVAQFLLDMFPSALESGLELADIAALVSEDEFSFDLEDMDLLDDDDFLDEFDDDEDDDL